MLSRAKETKFPESGLFESSLLPISVIHCILLSFAGTTSLLLVQT